MNIIIKDKQAIEKMRVAGKLTAAVLDMIGPHVKPGVTTERLDSLCYDFIINELQAIPAPLNYRGFPKSICTSVNHQVCHGIPGPKTLKEGDIVNIDVSVIKDGWHGDSSKMFVAGEASVLANRLIDVTQECLYIGIGLVKPGVSLKTIGAAIQQHAQANRFSVVREYCGHGIGEGFHEDPQVVHYDDKDCADIRLQEGMTFTIEPMINAGKRDIKMLPDKWTIVTKDHSLSAQWEHTLLVTPTGVEVLTLREEETELKRQLGIL
jgi:methionyl aminopeptidase